MDGFDGWTMMMCKRHAITEENQLTIKDQGPIRMGFFLEPGTKKS